MKFRRTILPAAFALAVVWPGIGGSAAAEDDHGLEFFEKRIRPVLVQHCYECHGEKKQENELRLDSAAGILAGGVGGPAVVAGKPHESLLLTAIGYGDAELKMPPKERLTAAQVADFTRWIEMGAPQPEGEGSGVAVRRTKIDWSTAGDHWAFKRPVAAPLPQVSDKNWPQTAIDYFIRARLEQAQLTPAAPADRRTLIRRATFDLIGLPPTPDEINAFLADPSPEAFAKVVDRLLASPAYGERWGRHWLDIARYADSNGLDENIAHGNAWRYRDWVVSALNDDMPYDEFVRQQLAGDLLPAADPHARNRQLIATGFLTLGPKVLAEVDEQKMEMDIVDEQIDTVGRSLLGLTLGCARCHDHKFDPIATEDYYALAGIFKSTKSMESFTKIARWHENPLFDEPYQKEKAAFDGQLAPKKKAVEDALTAATEKLKADLGAGAALPEKPEESFPQATRDELKKLRDDVAEFEKTAPVQPAAMGVGEGKVMEVAVHIRGNHLRQGDMVPRRFPRVLAGELQSPLAADRSGRLELAQWMTQPQHPLTARVIANRLWRWHFGRGLVESTDNFGRLGDKPTNAALLDWLALRLVNDGWSLKQLHREIMLSATYQMSSANNEAAAKVDPANHLQWRANLRRLEAEPLRDAVLAVSGQLDTAMGGTLLNTKNREFIFDHTSKDGTSYATQRRSIYLPVVRNHLHDSLTLFDFTDATVPSGSRNTSTVASQALYLMNGEQIEEAAASLAKRILAIEGDDAARVGALYELVIGRPPSDAETQRCIGFVEQLAKQSFAIDAWRLLCQTMLMSNEFVYLR